MDIVISDDVWIGAGAIILNGVNIGEGSIVGAGSVITHSVPPFTIVVGSRPQQIFPRFTKSKFLNIYSSLIKLGKRKRQKRMRSKPVIVMDLSSTGKDGGPYISSTRIMNSELNEKYEFKSIIYKTELGRNISIKRILDIKNQLLEIKPDIVHFTGLQLSGFHVALACKLAE